MPRLQIDIEARFAQFQDSLNQIDRKVSNFGAGLQRSISGVSAAFTAIGISAGLSAAGIVALGRSAINAQDDIGKMAQRVGSTAEELSALSFSAKLADVPLETLGQSLKKLSVNMLEMQAGTGEAKDAFRALGIDVTNASGGLRTSQEVLFDVADSFAKIEDGAGKTALAVKLFGRAGSELIPLLNAGSKGLKENAEEAKRFGIIISSEAAKGAEQFNDNMTRLQESSRGFGIAIANDTLPWLNKMVERLLEANRIGGGFLGTLKLLAQQSMSQMLNEPGQNIKNLTSEIERLQRAISNPQAIRADQGVGKRIEDLKKQIEFEKLLQRQQALSIQGGDTPGERARAFRPLAAAPRLPDETKRTAGIDKSKKALEEYLRVLKLQQEDEERQIQIQAELNKHIQQYQEANIAAAESIRNMMDPTRELEAEIEKVAKLMREGFLGPEEGDARIEAINIKLLDMRNNNAAANEELKRMIDLGKQLTASVQTPAEDMAEQFELWDQLLAKNVITFETWLRLHAEFEEKSVGVAATIKDASNTARDFGHAVSTAFEDAIVHMKKASEVGKAFIQTLAQIAIRATITKPLEAAIGSIFSGGGFGSIFGRLFGGGGGMGSVISDSGGRRGAGELLMVGRVPGGELWVPDTAGTMIPSSQLSSAGGDVHLTQNINIDSRSDRLEVMSAIRDMGRQTVATVSDLTRRGGSYRRAVRG